MNLGKKIAQGNTAEIFEYDDRRICKLFWKDYPMLAIEQEFKNSTLLYEATSLSPKCFEEIEIEGRKGLIYERLYGHDLLQELLEQISDMDKISSVLKDMTSLHKQLINHHLEGVVPYKTFFKNLVGQSDDDLIKVIDELPDGEFLCHGDFHPGNIWRNEDGSVSVIDCMNLCKGPKEYDVARTWFLLTELHENDKHLIEIKRIVGDMYLTKMGYNKEDIEKYLNVLILCRRFEC